MPSALTALSISSLIWINYTSNPDNLLAVIPVDFTVYSSVSVTTAGAETVVATQRNADGVIIDNLTNQFSVTANVGPLIEVVPPYTKTMVLLPANTSVQFTITGSGNCGLTFFTGKYAGTENATNYYQAQIQAIAMSETGIIKMFGGQPGNIPPGHLPCDGSAVSRSAYSALFAMIGTNFGAGDGSTTFNLPDMRGVSPMGAGGARGDIHSPARTLGQTVGSETVTLSVANLASHNHGLSDPGHQHRVLGTPGAAGGGGNYFADGNQYLANYTDPAGTGISISPTGSNTPFDIVHPCAIVNFIIHT